MRKILSIISVFALLMTGSGCARAGVSTHNDMSVTITMQIGNSMMTVNGTEKEIDPRNRNKSCCYK